jgi:DNA-directed RNA polymerase subunit M/transcription elongation factor TFIIS
MYLIINCPTCGKIIMASTANRTKTCTHCGARIPIYTAKILGKSETTQGALEIIQHLKQQENQDSSMVTFKKFKP